MKLSMSSALSSTALTRYQVVVHQVVVVLILIREFA